MDFETTIVLMLVILLLVLVGGPVGYYCYKRYYLDQYNYYYISYLDWEAIDRIFEDPEVTKYFQEWGPVERLAKTRSPEKIGCTNRAKQWFKKHVRNFTEAEKAALDCAVRYLRKQAHYSHKDWKFVKIHSMLEFGYPFTLGEYIFMPHQKLQEAVKAMHALKCVDYSQFEAAVQRATHTPWNSNKWDSILKVFTYLCAHERVHVHQRYNPVMYDKLYSSIGFKAVAKSKVVLDDWTLSHRVTNPDGRRGTMWLTEINDQWYLPMMVLDHVEHKPKSILLRVVQTKEGNWSPIVYLGKVVYYSMYDMPEYAHRFYLKHGMYDPNEIVAYLAADLVMKHKIEDTVFNKKILEFVRENASINNAQCRQLLDVSIHRAWYLLRKLNRKGQLIQDSSKRWARYRLANGPT